MCARKTHRFRERSKQRCRLLQWGRHTQREKKKKTPTGHSSQSRAFFGRFEEDKHKRLDDAKTGLNTTHTHTSPISPRLVVYIMSSGNILPRWNPKDFLFSSDVMTSLVDRGQPLKNKIYFFFKTVHHQGESGSFRFASHF